MHLSDFNMIFGKGNKNLYDFGENMSLVEKKQGATLLSPLSQNFEIPKKFGMKPLADLLFNPKSLCSDIVPGTVGT